MKKIILIISMIPVIALAEVALWTSIVRLFNEPSDIAVVAAVYLISFATFIHLFILKEIIKRFF
jgi:hypothetical protein